MICLVPSKKRNNHRLPVNPNMMIAYMSDQESREFSRRTWIFNWPYHGTIKQLRTRQHYALGYVTMSYEAKWRKRIRGIQRKRHMRANFTHSMCTSRRGVYQKLRRVSIVQVENSFPYITAPQCVECSGPPTDAFVAAGCWCRSAPETFVA